MATPTALAVTITEYRPVLLLFRAVEQLNDYA